MLPGAELLQIWSFPTTARCEQSGAGLINETYTVSDSDRPVAVVQRLNTTIFSAVVHEDIEAVTSHLARRGLTTPRLIRTRADALWHEDAAGGVWRALTWVGDRGIERVAAPADARAAGRLVAQFHAATADLEYAFRSVRGGFHDTAARLDALEVALQGHGTHRHHDAVAVLAKSIRAGCSGLDRGVDLPARVVHGDLKISNVRFSATEAVALIDLDTLGHGTLDAELGDALRSWCNRAGEDAAPAFDLALFSAAMDGYASGVEVARRSGRDGLADDEWEAIVPGVERIALELAARFATDALEERYFGWDARRFATRGDHNLARARHQLMLAESVRDARGEARRRLTTARRDASRAAEGRDGL